MKKITNSIVSDEVDKLKKIYNIDEVSYANIKKNIEILEKTYSDEEQDILKGQIKTDENNLKLFNKSEINSIEKTMASLIFYRTKLD